jgi:hypothetical protein
VNGGKTIKNEDMEKFKNIMNILFQMIAIFGQIVLCYAMTFEPESLNAMPTNTLVVVCTLIIMAFTIND